MTDPVVEAIRAVNKKATTTRPEVQEAEPVGGGAPPTVEFGGPASAAQREQFIDAVMRDGAAQQISGDYRGGGVWA